jgi:hypothetical protein
MKLNFVKFIFEKTKMKTIIKFLCAAFFLSSCKNEKSDSADKELYDETLNGSYTYYQNSNTILNAAGNSPHGTFKLKFNGTAQAALDSTGKLPVGSEFPTGSLIVKEIYSGGTSLTLYAIMKKAPGNVNAGSNWLWSEYKPGGETVVSVTDKGSGCISCHSGNVNRDLTNSFDLH